MKANKVLYLLCIFLVMELFQCSHPLDVIANLLISDKQEMDMGLKFHNQILENPTEYPIYTKNPAFNEYIESLGQMIVTHQPRTTIPFTFTVIDNDSTVNAFAVPGGYVYLYTGLVKAAKNEEEIAGVIAHEIGHIAMRHSVKRLVRIYGREQLISIILGSDKGLLKNIYNTALELQYGKTAEFEADSCAVAYSSLSGNNPMGMKTFLETLLNFTGSPSFLQKLFSTHPPTGERIDEVQRIIQNHYGQFVSNPTDSIKIKP